MSPALVHNHLDGLEIYLVTNINMYVHLCILRLLFLLPLMENVVGV